MLEGASLSTRPYDMTVGDNTKEEARENSWDDRVLVLLSTAAAPLPPPLRREAPAPVNAEPSRTGDEAEVTNVPRNTANTSAATSTMDVADEMMFLPPRLHFEPGVPFDRASTTPNSVSEKKSVSSGRLCRDGVYPTGSPAQRALYTCTCEARREASGALADYLCRHYGNTTETGHDE
jgi:hypothetical protein